MKIHLVVITITVFSIYCNGNGPLSRSRSNGRNVRSGLWPDFGFLDPGWNLTFSISGKNLGVDVKEPYVKVTYRTRQSTSLNPLGSGETGFEIDTSSTSNDPIWNDVFSFVRFQRADTKWHFSVYDRRNNDALIGEGVVDVNQYIESGQNYTLNLTGGITEAHNIVQLLITKTTPIRFKLSVRNLNRHDDFGAGRSDPFVNVHFRRGMNMGENIRFYTTSVINNVYDANWNDVIEFPNYQHGTGQVLIFQVWDKDTVTKNDFLGEATIDVDEYINRKGPKTVYLDISGKHSTIIITPAL